MTPLTKRIYIAQYFSVVCFRYYRRIPDHRPKAKRTRYTHAKHEEHDTSCTATEGEASSWPIIFLRCQVINTAMLVVFWWSSWMIMDNHNFWEALGNSPSKETRKGNKAVFDNTVSYPFWNHWSFLPSDWFSTVRFIRGQCVIYMLWRYFLKY